MDEPSVAILADDLIWSTRLADVVRGIGRSPITVRDLPGLTAALPRSSEVVVDLTARAYDGIAAVGAAATAGHRVLCVGQHDDRELRQRAIDAGAERVYAYRVLFERGPETLRGWLGGATPAGIVTTPPAAAATGVATPPPAGADPS